MICTERTDNPDADFAAKSFLTMQRAPPGYGTDPALCRPTPVKNRPVRLA